LVILNKPLHRFIAKTANGKIVDTANSYRFFYTGRMATSALLYELQLHGKKLAFPAYMCGSMTNYLRKCGFKICFYDIDNLCEFNLDVMTKFFEIHKPRAIFICHYFGLRLLNREQILKLAKNYSAEVIDDFCHSHESFYNYTYNKVNFVNAIFSFRKSLPVKVGGAYYSKRVKKIQNNKLLEMNSKSFNVIERIVNNLGWPNIYSEKIDYIRKLIMHEQHKKKSHSVSKSHEMCIDKHLSLYLSKNYTIKSSTQRLHNFENIVSLIDTSSNDFAVEKNIIVPQVIVIYDKTGNLVSFLRSNSIGAFKWPGLDLDFSLLKNNTYTGSENLQHKVACIPVHQGLSFNNIKTIAQKINHFYRK